MVYVDIDAQHVQEFNNPPSPFLYIVAPCRPDLETYDPTCGRIWADQ